MATVNKHLEDMKRELITTKRSEDYRRNLKERIQYDESFFSQMYGRFNELIAQSFEDLEGNELDLSHHFMLTVPLGIPITEDETKKQFSEFNSLRRTVSSYIARSGLSAVGRLLDSDVMEQTDMFFTSESLERYVLDVFYFARTGGLFDNSEGDFDYTRYFQEAYGILQKADLLAQKRGIDRFDIERVWAEIVFSVFDEMALRGACDREVFGNVTRYFRGNSFPEVRGQYLLNLIAASDIEEGERQILLDVLEDEGIRGVVPSETHGDLMSILRGELEGIYSSGRRSYHDQDILEGYTIEEITQTLHALRAEIETSYDREMFSILVDQIAYLVVSHRITEESKPDDFLDLIAFAQAVALNQNEYVEIVKSIFLKIQEIAFTDEPLYIPLLSYQELSQVAEAVADTGLSEQRFGISASFQEINFSLNDIASFRFMLSFVFMDYLLGIEEPSSVFYELNDFLNHWQLAVPFRDGLAEILGQEENQAYSQQLLDKIEQVLDKGIDSLDFDNQDTEFFYRVFLLSFLVQDVFIKNHVQRVALLHRVKLMSFDESMEFVFHQFQPNRTGGFAQAAEYLIEEKAETPEQLSRINSEVRTLFDFSDRRSLTALGSFVGMDVFMERIFRNQELLLRHLLATGNSDHGLREYLFEIWYGMFEDSIDLNAADAMDVRGELSDWAVAAPPRPGYDMLTGKYYYPLDQFVNNFYRMGPAARYMLLRKLLVSDRGGVLTYPEKRLRLLDDFLGQYLRTDGDEQLQGLLHQVLRLFVEISPEDRLYFMLSPLFQGRIANAPSNPSSWPPIVGPVVDRVGGGEPESPYPSADRYDEDKELLMLEEMEDAGIDYINASIKEGEISPEIEREYFEGMDEYYKYREAVERRLLTWIRGYSGDELQRSSAAERLFEIVPREEYQRESRTLSSLEFVIELARNQGTTGIRFLQLLGQFVNIPEEYRDEFLTVYEDIRGQSRLSAHHTLQRELPEYLSQIRRFGRRVGGGSLVTVYDVELQDGSREVVRVLNPNAEYHKVNTMETLTGVVDNLVKQDERFRPVEGLLQDLSVWIDSDIYDQPYFEDDQKFREVHHGYRPKGFQYKIRVPQSYDTGSRFVKREEYVEGQNFTDMTGLSDTDKKEIVGLAVRNYFEQIKGRIRDEYSLVHSDVHPGNLRVTPDKEVAILDRNFYLKLDRRDRFMFLRLTKAKGVKSQMGVFVDYLLGLEENKVLADELSQRGELEGIHERIVSEIVSGRDGVELEDVVLDMMVKLRDEGINIPLRFVLLMKNLNSLNRMAKEAGFDSLIEASKYRPKRASVFAKREPNGDGDDVTLAAGKYRKPKHGVVHETIENGLPEDLKGFQGLDPDEQEALKDKYRDSDGQIVIPIKGLIFRTGLLGHIGLGQYYDEPVIYVDKIFVIDRHVTDIELKDMSLEEAVVETEIHRVKAHEHFEIDKWEAKRIALGLSHKEMRAWIRKNSNEEGTGEAQRLADKWHKEAEEKYPIENIYEDNSLVRDYINEGRTRRIALIIFEAVQAHADEYKNLVKDACGIRLDAVEEVLFTSDENERRFASVVEDGSARIFSGLVEILDDDELAWVYAHEFTHIQLIRQKAKNLEKAKSNAGIPTEMPTPLRRPYIFSPKHARFLEEEARDKQAEEQLSDKMAIFLIAHAGFDPDAGRSAYVKVMGLSRRIFGGEYKDPIIEALKGSIFTIRIDPRYKDHPPDEERLVGIEEAARRYHVYSLDDIYAEEKDVVLAAQPSPSSLAREFNPRERLELLLQGVESQDRWGDLAWMDIGLLYVEKYEDEYPIIVLKGAPNTPNAGLYILTLTGVSSKDYVLKIDPQGDLLTEGFLDPEELFEQFLAAITAGVSDLESVRGQLDRTAQRQQEEYEALPLRRETWEPGELQKRKQQLQRLRIDNGQVDGISKDKPLEGFLNILTVLLQEFIDRDIEVQHFRDLDENNWGRYGGEWMLREGVVESRFVEGGVVYLLDINEYQKYGGNAVEFVTGHVGRVTLELLDDPDDSGSVRVALRPRFLDPGLSLSSADAIYRVYRRLVDMGIPVYVDYSLPHGKPFTEVFMGDFKVGRPHVDLRNLQKTMVFFIGEEVKKEENREKFKRALSPEYLGTRNRPIVLVERKDEMDDMVRFIYADLGIDTSHFKVATFDDVGLDPKRINQYLHNIHGIDNFLCIPVLPDSHEELRRAAEVLTKG